TLGFMLALLRNLYKSSNELKAGTWDKNGGVNLTGRTVGIIGVGHVGKEVVRLLKPFGCKILVNDIIDQRNYYQAQRVEEVSKDDLFARADVVTVHTPLTPLTKHLINAKTLAAMRPGAYVINTARGPLVDYTALKEALRSGTIAGAAVDVYDEEPPKDKELLALDNLICTPHIGGNSKESVLSMGMAAIEHLKQELLA
ncbi:MAG: NAD(P)-dependent oxidoreductase, partial [Patescibacteria group bacterium]